MNCKHSNSLSTRQRITENKTEWQWHRRKIYLFMLTISWNICVHFNKMKEERGKKSYEPKYLWHFISWMDANLFIHSTIVFFEENCKEKYKGTKKVLKFQMVFRCSLTIAYNKKWYNDFAFILIWFRIEINEMRFFDALFEIILCDRKKESKE